MPAAGGVIRVVNPDYQLVLSCRQTSKVVAVRGAQRAILAYLITINVDAGLSCALKEQREIFALHRGNDLHLTPEPCAAFKLVKVCQAAVFHLGVQCS